MKREAGSSAALTSEAARELGRVFRFVRKARDQSLRDVAARARLSPQYVQNLERGERLAASETAYLALSNGYGLAEDITRDLLLKARIVSALQRRGITANDAAFVWNGVEGRLRERGLRVRTEPTDIVAEVLGQPKLPPG